MRNCSQGKPQGRIRPVDRGAGWLACVVHLNTELARLGMAHEHLHPYQVQALSEIEGGLSNDALDKLFHWWDYDLEKLMQRGQSERPARPRIEISMRFNQRGRAARSRL
jgi:hypothetical protein